MAVSFDRAFKIVVEVEGGYVNNPNDPGGETIYGITKRDHPDLWAVGRPTIEQAKIRYQTQYWAPVKADQLPWPLSLYLFDTAINQGPGTAIKILQRAAGTVQDGVLGQNTLRAITQANQDDLCEMFLANRALRYVGTRNFDIYGRGWFKRLFHLARAQ
jgi:lysozyme family protein